MVLLFLREKGATYTLWSYTVSFIYTDFREGDATFQTKQIIQIMQDIMKKQIILHHGQKQVAVSQSKHSIK